MLNSSSLHYYVCYCALICLSCQQRQHLQQANAVTIIIDGASSSEWATRDEYQRLADAQAAGGGEPNQQQELAGGGGGGGVSGDAPTSGGRFAAANLALEPARRLDGDSGASEPADLADLLATSGATQRRGLVAADETGEISFRGHQQQQQNQQGNEFDRALDWLDLVERERQAEVARLRQLDALERVAESGAARALSHQAQATGAQINVADIPPDAYVAMAKANRRRKQRDVPKRRCGDDLTKALEFVCKHRFYNGDTQPELVQPAIKSKRSVDNNQDQMAALAEQQRVGPTVARRRKLRTLQQQQEQQQREEEQQLHDGSREFEEDGDGGPARTSSSSSLSSSSSSLQHSSSRQQQQQHEPELLSLSSPSISSSSSSLLNNKGIDNTPHNHNQNLQRELQQQQQQQQYQQRQQSEYLSNYGGRDRDEESEQGSNNLRGKIRSKKALMRRIRGASEECCERSCTYADMEAYCAAASSQSQTAAG